MTPQARPHQHGRASEIPRRRESIAVPEQLVVFVERKRERERERERISVGSEWEKETKRRRAEIATCTSALSAI